jgi:hypothetical protein
MAETDPQRISGLDALTVVLQQRFGVSRAVGMKFGKDAFHVCVPWPPGVQGWMYFGGRLSSVAHEARRWLHSDDFLVFDDEVDGLQAVTVKADDSSPS